MKITSSGDRNITIGTSNRRSKVFWGIVLIGAAVFLILDGLGVSFGLELSFWKIALGVLCLSWFAEQIAEGNIGGVIFSLAFLFLIFESTIANAIGRPDGNLISNWLVLLAALLLTIGFKAILPKKSGGKKFVNIGAKTIMLDGAELSDAVISNNVGPNDVYITNTEAYTYDGKITITDNVGRTRLYLPKTWHVILEATDNIGKIDMPSQADGVYERSITVVVTDNVGQVSIIFG
ncbi:MAG: hypothetical protein IJQ80_06775 [Clostridia bacterium]|nr:hypothetical protein [Clostridia bacterium]